MYIIYNMTNKCKGPRINSNKICVQYLWKYPMLQKNITELNE